MRRLANQNLKRVAQAQAVIYAKPTPMSTQHTVFLSHQSADKPIVSKVAARLVAAGVGVIYDDWSFQPGCPLTEEIESGIRTSTGLVLFWSQHSAASDYVQFEDELALARSIKDDSYRVQVIRLDSTELPSRYSRLIYHDWRKGKPGSKLFAAHVDILLRAILGKPPSEPDLSRIRTASILMLEDRQLDSATALGKELRKRLEFKDVAAEHVSSDDVLVLDMKLDELRDVQSDIRLQKHDYSAGQQRSDEKDRGRRAQQKISSRPRAGKVRETRSRKR